MSDSLRILIERTLESWAYGEKSRYGKEARRGKTGSRAQTQRKTLFSPLKMFLELTNKSEGKVARDHDTLSWVISCGP